jgi:K+ transporter
MDHNCPMVLAMMRDNWWWPWWVSTLIDIGIVLVGLVVFRLSSRRIVRAVAGLLVLVGLVAAVMAPIVMTESDDNENPPMMR